MQYFPSELYTGVGVPLGHGHMWCHGCHGRDNASGCSCVSDGRDDLKYINEFNSDIILHMSYRK